MIIADSRIEFAERLRQLFHMPPRGAINQRGAGPRLADERLKRLDLFRFGRTEIDRKSKIGPPKTGNDRQGVAEFQLIMNVLLDSRGRRGRQRETGGRIQLPPQFAQPQVIRSKIMAPMGNTMSFIDDE